jgi:SAM-dependent methyltransferase
VNAGVAQRPRFNDPRYGQRVRAWEALTNVVTPSLLDALAPAPGERVLDVGCGAGAATARAARLVAPAGRVVGADLSPALVDVARHRAAHSDNVYFQVADLQTAQVLGGPFHAIMSQFGVMFFDEPVAAFTNIRRQLRPDGRICFACWQRAESNPWSYAHLLTDLIAAPQSPSSIGPFALAEADHATALLRAADLDDVRVSSRRVNVEVRESAIVDDDELALMGVPPERIPDALQRVDQHLSAYRTASGNLALPLAFHILTARRCSRLGAHAARS